MHTPITQWELVGRRADLDTTVRALQRIGVAEIVEPPPAETAGDGDDAQARLSAILERIERLLALSGTAERDLLRPDGDDTVDPGAVEALLDRVDATVGPLLQQRAHLQAEADALPGRVESLESLLPLVPELSELSDAELAEIHLASIALVLDDPDGAVLAGLTDELDSMLGARYLLVSNGMTPTVSCLIVLAAEDVAAVEELLGRSRVAHVGVGTGYGHRSLASTARAMRERLESLPALTADVDASISRALDAASGQLRVAGGAVTASLERLAAVDAAQLGERTFTLQAWVPLPQTDAFRETIAALPEAVVAAEVPRRRWRSAPPVVLRNWRLFRPFERLVGFLSYPRDRELDPTGLMAIVLPILFGIMVGDIGYGLLLVLIAWLIRRRFGGRSAAAVDIARVLGAGGWWSVVFGALFGELFGDFGRYAFGMPALWFYRGGPEALTPLLLFVLGVGAVHVVLGLVIGLWQSIRARHRGHALERGGNLLVIIGLFVAAAELTQLLPIGLLTPGVILIVVGIVIASVGHGALGALLGPLEVVGTIGNILSYLRLAAVGLASVYLAIVANELGRQAPLVLGILIAVLFHALNLALAGFSPMIQALRLHYVEFFGKFYEGGGRPFRPLGALLPTRTAAEAGVHVDPGTLGLRSQPRDVAHPAPV